MKTVIIYQSLLGSTKKYAFWLREKTKASIFTTKQIRGTALEPYDRIIVMSGTYAGRMPFVQFLQENWEFVKDKQITAVVSGAIPADSVQSKTAYDLIPSEIKAKISYFKLPGRLVFANKKQVKPSNLNPILRSLLTSPDR